MSWLADTMPVRYLRIFWGYARARILVVVALTLVSSYAESFGLALFFPLFASATTQPTDAVSRTFVSIFHALGLQPTPAAALPLIAGIFAFKGMLAYATTMYQERLGLRVVRGIRTDVLSAAGRADYRRATEHGAGDNAHMIVFEVARAAAGFQMYVRSIPPLLSAGVLFLVVALIDWRSTLVCVGMGLTLVLALRITGRVASEYSNVFSKQTGRLTSLLVQTFQAFKYLRATSSFGVFERHVVAASDASLDANLKASTAGAAMQALVQPVMVLFLSGLLYYRTAIRGEQLASLFVVLLYFLRIMSELFALQTSWQSFCSYAGSVDGVRARLADDLAHAEANGTVPFTGMQNALRCDRVSFAYDPERPVLHDVELTIPRHTTVAFVGSSGSGKSTLVDLLTGTLKPDRGAVTIDGTSLSHLDLATLRRRIGYVAQEAIVFDDTVANNIALWRPELDRAAIERAAASAYAAEFIEAMPEKYDAPIGDRGVMLSGGQRQRLAIARELVKSPELLVLDEATSALDSQSERAIQASIDALRGTMTILIIAHRLSTVRSADRIYVLHEGRIVEQGSYEELVAAGGRFRQMVELQSLGAA